MQINTKMGFHLVSVRMSAIKNPRDVLAKMLRRENPCALLVGT